jgi:hypothetical protein
MRLDDDQLEQLADLITDRLANVTLTQTRALLTAPELAEALRVEVKSVYRHADELGAIRVGGALRFDAAVALAVKPSTSAETTRPRTASKRHRRASAPKLLDVGRRAA